MDSAARVSCLHGLDDLPATDPHKHTQTENIIRMNCRPSRRIALLCREHLTGGKLQIHRMYVTQKNRLMILFQIKCRQRWQKHLSNHASVGVQEYRITFPPR